MRSLAAGMVTAATAETGEYCYLLSFAFSGGTLYLTTASTDIDWSGNTYQAIGELTFEAVSETRERTDQAVRITWAWVDQPAIARIRQENWLRRTATIHIAHFSSGAIIADPVQVWSGVLSEAWRIRESWNREGGSTSIETGIMSPFVVFRQTRGIRANVPSHSSVYPGDTFFRHLLSIQGRPIFWGGAAPILGGASGVDPGTAGEEGLGDDNRIAF